MALCNVSDKAHSEISTMEQGDLLGMEKWLVQHHYQADDEIHVYAYAGPPPFDTSGKHWDFHIQIPIPGVIIKFHGYIDLDSYGIDANLSIVMPFFGEITLAHVKGDLRQGITVNLKYKSIVSGSARFYLKGKELWVDLDAKFFSLHFKKSIKLIALPFK